MTNMGSFNQIETISKTVYESQNKTARIIECYDCALIDLK